MSSFQFPANPSDGDIVVRGNLQAFYNAATNTWRVSEVPTAPGIPGPPGPPGPQGPPGEGMKISGSVDTEADLPAPPSVQYEFWLVDDVNEVFWSDGIKWVNVGGPIQGPQGDKGEDGANGTNGQNGRGWYDTNIIDERPTNYQVQFLSNDGLGFTTDNIMGPQGEPGDLEVASKDNLGAIKVGRGLNILPDGTLQAGETYVDIETVPLGPDGEPDSPSDNYSVDFEPIFTTWTDTFSSVPIDGSAGSGRGWTVSHEETITMPELADGAIIYYFSSSGTVPYALTGTLALPGWFTGETRLEVEDATFADGGNITVPHYINFAGVPRNPGGNGATPTTKISLMRFPKGGANVTFKASCRVDSARKVSYSIGRGRLAIVPFKSGTGDNTRDMAALMDEFSRNLAPGTDFEGFPETTPEQNLEYETVDLKIQINQVKSFIDGLVVQEFPQGTAGYTELMTLRQELIDVRNLPGNVEAIAAEINRISEAVDAIGSYTFRFE